MAQKPDKWDMEIDVLVIGTGAAGLTAATLAHDDGAKVIVIEKSDKVGGTTSASGGGVWIPNNHHMAEKGVKDSKEEAMVYCRQITKGRVFAASGDEIGDLVVTDYVRGR